VTKGAAHRHFFPKCLICADFSLRRNQIRSYKFAAPFEVQARRKHADNVHSL
jgi:hypothetical protein